MPVLTGATAHPACRVAHAYPGGGHSIVLGEVVSAPVRSPTPQPLVFFDGTMGALRG